MMHLVIPGRKKEMRPWGENDHVHDGICPEKNFCFPWEPQGISKSSAVPKHFDASEVFAPSRFPPSFRCEKTAETP